MAAISLQKSALDNVNMDYKGLESTILVPRCVPGLPEKGSILYHLGLQKKLAFAGFFCTFAYYECERTTSCRCLRTGAGLRAKESKGPGEPDPRVSCRRSANDDNRARRAHCVAGSPKSALRGWESISGTAIPLRTTSTTPIPSP